MSKNKKCIKNKRILRKIRRNSNDRKLLNVKNNILDLEINSNQLKKVNRNRGVTNLLKLSNLKRQLNPIQNVYMKNFPEVEHYRRFFGNCTSLPNVIDECCTKFFLNYSGYCYTLKLRIEDFEVGGNPSSLREEINILFECLKGLPLAYGVGSYEIQPPVHDFFDAGRVITNRESSYNLPILEKVEVEISFFLVFYNEFMCPYDHLLSGLLFDRGISYCRIERFSWDDRLKKLSNMSFKSVVESHQFAMLFHMRYSDREVSKKIIKLTTGIKEDIYFLCGLTNFSKLINKMQRICIRKGYKSRLIYFNSEKLIPPVSKNDYRNEIREYLNKLISRTGLFYLAGIDKFVIKDRESKSSYKELDMNLTQFFFNLWKQNLELNKILLGIKGDIIGQIDYIRTKYYINERIPLSANTFQFKDNFSYCRKAGCDNLKGQNKFKNFIKLKEYKNLTNICENCYSEKSNIFKTPFIDALLVEFIDGYYSFRTGLFINTLNMFDKSFLKAKYSENASLYTKWDYGFNKPYRSSNVFVNLKIKDIKFPFFSIHYVLNKFEGLGKGILFLYVLGSLIHRNDRYQRRLLILRGSKSSGKSCLMDNLFIKTMSKKFVGTIYHTATTYQEYYDEAYKKMEQELKKRRGEATKEQVEKILENVNISKVTHSWINFQDNVEEDLFLSIMEKLRFEDFESTIISTKLSTEKVLKIIEDGGYNTKQGLKLKMTKPEDMYLCNLEEHSLEGTKNAKVDLSLFYLFELKDVPVEELNEDYKIELEKESFSFMMFCNLLYLKTTFSQVNFPFKFPVDWYNSVFDFKGFYGLNKMNGLKLLDIFTQVLLVNNLKL